MAAIGAELVPRFEALLDSGLAGIDLDSSIRGADLVITAEGAIDFQTPRGKVPAEVARRASEQGVPVIGLAGTLGQGSDAVHGIGIDAVASILPVPMSLAEAVRDGEELLIEATERFMRTLMLGASIAEDRLVGDETERGEPVPRKRLRRLATVQPADEVEDVLATMQRTGTHLARVVDDAGSTLGVVFLEDIIEELVGEVRDSTTPETA